MILSPSSNQSDLQYDSEIERTMYINEVNLSSLEQQLANLTSLVHQIAIGNTCREKAPIEQIYATNDFYGQPQGRYDSYSNTYNQGWWDQPNLQYQNPLANQDCPNYQ